MSGPKKTKATARVRVTLDIHITDQWGHDCSVDQIYKQAADRATDALRRGLYLRDGLKASDIDPAAAATIIDVKPVAVFAEEER